MTYLIFIFLLVCNSASAQVQHFDTNLPEIQFLVKPFHRTIHLTNQFFKENEIPFNPDLLKEYDHTLLPDYLAKYSETRFIFKRIRFETRIVSYPKYFSMFATSRVYLNKRLSLSWGSQVDFNTLNIKTVDLQNVIYFDAIQYIQDNYYIAAKGISDISLVPGIGYNLYMYKNHPFTIFFQFNLRVFHKNNSEILDEGIYFPSPYLKYTIGFRGKAW